MRSCETTAISSIIGLVKPDRQTGWYGEEDTMKFEGCRVGSSHMPSPATAAFGEMRSLGRRAEDSLPHLMSVSSSCLTLKTSERRATHR